MLLKFTKMHGLGNDFVVIDAISQHITITPEIAKKVDNLYKKIISINYKNRD